MNMVFIKQCNDSRYLIKTQWIVVLMKVKFLENSYCFPQAGIAHQIIVWLTIYFY